MWYNEFGKLYEAVEEVARIAERAERKAVSVEKTLVSHPYLPQILLVNSKFCP